MVTIIDFDALLEEFQDFLRTNDVLTITERGVTTVASETFSGDNSTTTFTMANTGLKNIRSVEVNSSAQTKYTDYTIDWDNNQITFTTAPPTGTDNIDVSYDYGTGDAIYSDFPRDDLDQQSYPRIGFDVISATTEDQALRGATRRTNVLISLNVYAPTKRKINDVIKAVRQAVADNSTSVGCFAYMRPIGMGRLIVSPDRGNKIMQRNIDFSCPYEFEQ